MLWLRPRKNAILIPRTIFRILLSPQVNDVMDMSIIRFNNQVLKSRTWSQLLFTSSLPSSASLLYSNLIFSFLFLVCHPVLPLCLHSPSSLSVCDRSMLYPFGFPLQLYSPGNWAQLVSQGASDFSQASLRAHSSSVIYIITCSLHQTSLFFFTGCFSHLLPPPVRTIKPIP